MWDEPDDDPLMATRLAWAARSVDADDAVRRRSTAVLAAWERTRASRDADRARPGHRGWLGRPAAPWLAACRTRLDNAAWRWRRSARPVVAGLAILVATAGTAAAATAPGAPLYATRLAVETAAMPASGSQARALAEVAYAERRLDEAADAMARRDDRGAVAAVEAFTDVLHRLAADAPRDALPQLAWPLAEHLREVAKAGGRTADVDAREALAAADRELDGLRGRPFHEGHPGPRPARGASPRQAV